MKGSIRSKLLMSFCILIILVISSQTIFNLFFSKSFFTYRKKKQIENSYYQVKSAYGDDLTNLTTIADQLHENYALRILVSKDNEVIYSTDSSTLKKMPIKDAKTFHPDETRFSERPTADINPKSNPEMKFLQLNGKFDYNSEEIHVSITLPMSSIEDSVSILTQAGIYISVAVLIIGIIIAILLSKTITSPILSIEKVSKQIANLDFSYIANENINTKELSSLAKSINQMSKNLKDSMNELQVANHKLKKDIDYQKKIEGLRREFVASVSHEMKTPLSLLQLYSENLRNNIDGIDRDYYCDTIIEETEKLSDMVSNMLEFSSIDSGFIKLNFETFSISDLCNNIVEQYKPILCKYTFTSTICDNVNINGDKKYIEQVIKNLLNNAIQHTKDGSNINLSLGTNKKNINISVFNEGCHIQEEDIPHIFDAFYRADKSRTRTKNNNIGLGLYIVKTVVDKHSGYCDIKNTENGVLATISLPINI